MGQNNFNEINDVISGIKFFLQEKNKRYKNAALEPLNIFSKLSSETGICVRLDDKLRRIQNSKELSKNDVVDIIGYLVLLCVDQGWHDFKDLID